MRYRWDAGRVLADEVFEVRNDGNETFEGKVYAWLPADAEVTLFGPGRGVPADQPGGGLVAFDLAAHYQALEPNETLRFSLAWSAPLGPGGGVERRLVYPTARLEVEAAPPLVLAGRPGPGEGDFADVVRVALPAQPLFEGWQLLVLFAAALLAGAFWWDRRRRRR